MHIISYRLSFEVIYILMVFAEIMIEKDYVISLGLIY
jgi:hypothetical protein